MGASVRFFICLVFLLNLFATLSFADKADAEPGRVAAETAFLATETERYELIRLAYSEDPATKANPTGDDSLPKAQRPGGSDEYSAGSDLWEDEAESIDSIPDPLEPMNRAFFQFNDKLYFWVLKPVATGYSKVVPQVARVCIRNFFSNLVMPIRAVSCLLQGKFEGLGIELVRFVVNTSAGFLGFQDVAKQALNFPVQDEDLGQVFAFYGVGPGFYLSLPFLGPYSFRDAVGWGGGLFINPFDYVVDFWPNVGIRTYDILNSTSLRIGDYEAMKEAALDPYVAMRDAYYQYRLNQIEK